jgi:outer membrane protein assembly factor BamB
LTDAELASPQVLEPVTITYVAPKKYPTGTLTFEHTFPDNGKFIGIVTVKDGHGKTYVSQFPFSVGQPLGKSIGMYGLMVGVLMVALLSLWQYSRRQPSALPKNPA